MSDIQMGVSETRFAEIIWENEPVTAAKLSEISEKELGWKKSTSYTVLKRLCGKGIFQNADGAVTSVLSKEQFYAVRSRQFVESTFGGSLPAFIASFTQGKKLSDEEREAIRRMIDSAKEE